MSTCKIQKGFFLLRECGRPAANTCSQCGIPICGSHMSIRDGAWFCIECASSTPTGRINDRGDDVGFWDTNESTYGYRKEYYRDRSHRPIDTHLNNNFSHSDFSAFDKEDDATFDGDDSAKVDFGDS